MANEIEVKGDAYAQAESDVRKMREAAPEGTRKVTGDEFHAVMVELGEANFWGGSPPFHVSYYGLNVGCGFMSAQRYVDEFPSAVAAVLADHAKFLEAREAARQAKEAAKLAESKAVQFIAGLDDTKLGRLAKLLAEEQAGTAQATTVDNAAAIDNAAAGGAVGAATA